MMDKTLTIKMGRPTLYINKIPRRVTQYREKCLKNGIFPTIEGLAAILGVSTRSIYAWEKEFPELMHTTELLRDTQRSLLIENGLNGKYSTSFAIFLLKAMHGFTDSKALIEANQNNYFDVSPEVLADALKIMKENKS